VSVCAFKPEREGDCSFFSPFKLDTLLQKGITRNVLTSRWSFLRRFFGGGTKGRKISSISVFEPSLTVDSCFRPVIRETFQVVYPNL